MNKKTKALTSEQYKEIVATIRNGFLCHRPNERVALALMLEANLGLRVSDIVKLRLDDIVLDGNRYHLEIREQKTGKVRSFTVPLALYQFLKLYCIDHKISSDTKLVPITERQVQKLLKSACDYLAIEGVSTHSFRKFYATEIYRQNGNNIVLVQTLLQHSSPSVTQRYIGIQPEEIEKAIEKHLFLDL